MENVKSIKNEQAERIRSNTRRLLLSSAFAEAIISCARKERDLFDSLIQEELIRREDNKIANNIRRAGFPTLKRLEDYDFSELKFPESISKESVVSLSFIPDCSNLVLYGICGSGKTMLAIALALNACRENLKVKFYTLASLALKLKEDNKAGKLQYTLNTLKKLDLLIIDEWGYCQLDKESANFIYQVIADSYEHKSLIITTNLPFGEWGKIFADPQLAAAIIDRVVHYGHLITTGNKDWRLINSPMNSSKTAK